jgi:hypothetical protein
VNQPLDNQMLAYRAAGDIIRTLLDRKGFDDWFYGIAPEFQQEIRDAVAERIYDAVVNGE